MLSVDENTPMSAIPNTGTWCPGALNSTRYFDVSIAGKCSDGQAKINFQSADKIPSFFTKNAEGKIVFAAPQVVGVITPAKEHGSWVTIQLQSINGQDITSTSLSDVAKHVCLGIRKQGESEYFDVIHAGKLTSEYVDVTRDAAVELVPFLSKTATSASGYTAVIPGDEVKFTDITIPTTGSFDFGSVYRISLEDHGQWLMNQPCDLGEIEGSGWFNWGSLGIGSIIDSEGNIHKDQFLAACYWTPMAYSSDGKHWTRLVKNNNGGYTAGMKYGNGVWYSARGVRSVDMGRTWLATRGMGDNLHFANGMFISILSNGEVYSSSDAENWVQIGTVPGSYSYRFLVYGNGKWICVSFAGEVFWSKDGKGAWTSLENSDNAPQYGGCYANGCYYGSDVSGGIFRSPDGENWEKIATLPASIGTNTLSLGNITYYKGKLYVFNDSHGESFQVGLI